MKQLGMLVALTVVLLGVGKANADLRFIEARLTLRGEAQVYPDVLQWQVADRYVTGGYADESASLTVSSSTNNGTAIALLSAAMTWKSKVVGRVTFDDVGFVQAILHPSGMADVNNSGWHYTFTTGQENEFKVKYAIGIGDSTAEIVGIQGFTVEVDQNGQAIYSQDLDLNTSGTLAVPLSPYQTYTVRIVPNGAFYGDSGLAISSMWGDFSWAIRTRNR